MELTAETRHYSNTGSCSASPNVSNVGPPGIKKQINIYGTFYLSILLKLVLQFKHYYNNAMKKQLNETIHVQRTMPWNNNWMKQHILEPKLNSEFFYNLIIFKN